MPTTQIAGHLIVRALEAHEVERVFVVPGESFLGVLDGLHGSRIDTVVCRHEGGAGYMAEAQGKLTGRPGVAMVTRGPGAANALVSVHAANQDATPMVLFVGLIPVADRDRFAFQEFDPRAWFGGEAKAVLILDDPDQAFRVVASAFAIAASGRPGPVIVGVPEDVLVRPTEAVAGVPIPIAEGGLAAEDLRAVEAALGASERPVLLLGGPHWSAAASDLAAAFASEHRIPVLHEWRATDRVPFADECNAGWLGYGADPAAVRLFEEADLVIAVGAVHGDVITDGFRLRQRPDAVNLMVSLDPELVGHGGSVTAHILASPERFFRAVLGLRRTPPPGAEERYRAAAGAAARYRTLTEAPRPAVDGVDPRAVFARLVAGLPRRAIFSFGAGNHCAWAQRFLPTEVFPSQLGMRNGSMGYSVPAAVAASLEFPDRLAVAVCGDGELLMNGQELATATQYGARVLVVVLDNGVYGTIRDHQRTQFPGRPSGIELQNPDFAAWARSFGALGVHIETEADIDGAVATALDTVLEARGSALLHVRTDPSCDLP